MTLPPELLWPGVVVIAVIAIFVTAALCGPLIRANQREDIDDSEEERKETGGHGDTGTRGSSNSKL